MAARLVQWRWLLRSCRSDCHGWLEALVLQCHSALLAPHPAACHSLALISDMHMCSDIRTTSQVYLPRAALGLAPASILLCRGAYLVWALTLLMLNTVAAAAAISCCCAPADLAPAAVPILCRHTIPQGA